MPSEMPSELVVCAENLHVGDVFEHPESGTPGEVLGMKEVMGQVLVHVRYHHVLLGHSRPFAVTVTIRARRLVRVIHRPW